jgi:hypothetical protein
MGVDGAEVGKAPALAKEGEATREGETAKVGAAARVGVAAGLVARKTGVGVVLLGAGVVVGSRVAAFQATVGMKVGRPAVCCCWVRRRRVNRVGGVGRGECE